MEYEKKTIDIPEEYEIDIEETKKQNDVVALRKQLRPTNWAELTRMSDGKESFLYDNITDEVIKDVFVKSFIAFGEFEDKETTCAFVALWKLLNYRKAWIGDWKPDWTSCDAKFVITTNNNNIEHDCYCFYVSSAMSFPTEKMRDEFYESFKDLLEVAKPLL